MNVETFDPLSLHASGRVFVVFPSPVAGIVLAFFCGFVPSPKRRANRVCVVTREKMTPVTLVCGR
jgi:hypothetical protein